MARRQGAQMPTSCNHHRCRGVSDRLSDSQTCADMCRRCRADSDCVEFCRSGGTLLSLLVAALGFAFADLSICSTSPQRSIQIVLRSRMKSFFQNIKTKGCSFVGLESDCSVIRASDHLAEVSQAFVSPSRGWLSCRFANGHMQASEREREIERGSQRISP